MKLTVTVHHRGSTSEEKKMSAQRPLNPKQLVTHEIPWLWCWWERGGVAARQPDRPEVLVWPRCYGWHGGHLYTHLGGCLASGGNGRALFVLQHPADWCLIGIRLCWRHTHAHTHPCGDFHGHGLPSSFPEPLTIQTNSLTLTLTWTQF